ncbi:AraC family transcriptional regulator [Mediterraneibacter faecis]|uniref:AraC family transcriptional regulator n=1 Tax=Mediterraneibacter faecis TaxID=592978 RepID=UPI0022E1A6FB|nr:AraC family transcriptional regulator [Mediterraneibacter faecis]
MTNTKSSAQPPFGSVGFHITSALPLQTLRGIGMHHITSHDYHWDNRVRKNSYVLLQYTISGKGSFQTPDHTYPQQTGDLFLVQVPGDSQYSLPDNSEYWDVLYLEFSSECLPLLYHIHQSCGPAFHLEASSTLPEQMKQLYADAISNQLASVFDNSKSAYAFLLDLADYALEHPALSSPRVTLAKNYLDSHYYTTDLNLDEVADAVGLSKYHLCREFNHLYGISPGKYLANLRLQKSCALLLQSRQHTIAEIASLVGFSNDNYFCKVFRKAFGTTPTQYRLQNQNYDLVRVLHDSHSRIPSDK